HYTMAEKNPSGRPGKKLSGKTSKTSGQPLRPKRKPGRKPTITPTRKQGRKGSASNGDTIIRILIILVIIVLAALLFILIFSPGFFGSETASEPNPYPEPQIPLPADPSVDPSAEQYPDPQPDSDPPPKKSAENAPAAEKSAENAPAAEKPPPAGEVPLLIIVIDDVGYNLEDVDAFLEIPISVTFAVLPQVTYSDEAAVRIAEAGQELILHLPMESRTGQFPGPGTLTEEMSDAELMNLIQENSRTVPGIIGINNHMGSKGTEDRRIVSAVLEFAQQNSLFFLDSRTTANTVIPELIPDYGIAFAERDVFLDNSKIRSDIADSMETGKNTAREQGYAVLIGHVGTRELAQFLLEEYSGIISEGFEFAALSRLFSGEK
ncbi:MAG: divergent polysaccharide deacetylase family protein, partial [Salinispira sp.]